MKTFVIYLKSVTAISASALIILSLASCSDDEPTPPPSVAKQHTFDHSHGDEVTDLEKHKFEHDFAEQCVERETRNSVNKALDKKRYSKPCMCIATYMMKDLTAPEAEKFLKENKNTRSLQIRFDNAAYHCLQKQKSPKSPVIFKKRK